jgi:uncharacterized protein YlxP (DUF503 family)
LDDVRIYTGTLVADLVLPGSRSLKDLRAPLRALAQRLRNRDFAVARVGPTDRQQRAFLAIVAVAGESEQAEGRLDEAERLVYDSPFEVADLRRALAVETFPCG